MRALMGLFASISLVAGCGETTELPTPDTAIESQPAILTNVARAEFGFRSLGISNVFFCSIDGGELTVCVPPFAATLPDGMHTFAVAAGFNANVDETPATYSWLIDTVAPTTQLLAGPPAIDNDTTPEFTFDGTDSEGAVSFECAIDGGATAPCASPFSPTVADGDHTFTVTAVDAAGNRDASPVEHVWLVTTIAPDTTIEVGPANGTTSAGNVVFQFASPAPNTTFECSLDAGAFVPCTSPRTLTNLASGNHVFAVRALSIVGADPSPASRDWNVDATAPITQFDATPADPSNDTTPTFAFSASETATFECSLDGGAFAACTSPVTAAALGDGGHTFAVRATDAVGNLGGELAFAWAIDTAAPTVTINTEPAALSNDTTATITFTVAGGPAGTTCAIDGGSATTCSSPFTTAALTDGTHTITVAATDSAGNVGTATTNTFEVDTIAPTATITNQPAALSNNNDPVVTFSTAGAPTSTQCRLDTGAFSACASPVTFTNVSDGTHTITVRVADGAGNVTTTATNAFTIDTVAPTVTITSQPAALSNNNDPVVAFTTAGGPTAIECRLDAGAFAACTSPATFTNVADGTHTITVHVSDGAGNSNSATTSSFVIDTAPPVVTFVDAPPASWPVNYYDVRFQANETATFQCSLNGGAFTTCASGSSITTTYNTASTFAVRATDAVGNTSAPVSTSWTSSDGLVLHYPWEQGDTDNTSLLSQRPPYSPTGSTVTTAVVGGWAGTALGSSTAAINIKETRRVLTSSASPGNYTGGFWLRLGSGATGTVIDTLAATGGLRVTVEGIRVTVTVRDPSGSLHSQFVSLATNQWFHIALLATGPAKGLIVLVDGNFAELVNAPLGTGFDNGQANDLRVGPWSGFDVDDLRFFNTALSNTSVCTQLARGRLDIEGTCVALSPGFELDFENDAVTDTGRWGLQHTVPSLVTFLLGRLGDAFHLDQTFDLRFTSGFAANVRAAPGHSFSLWFEAKANFGTLIDFTGPCATVLTCGIAVTYTDNGRITVFVGTSAGVQKTVVVPVDEGKMNSVVVTEQKTDPKTTDAITVFVNGVKTEIVVGAGDVYNNTSDSVRLTSTANLLVDEYEFWEIDLTGNVEMLCENGFDGEFDHVAGTCALTSN
jgi:hypothetical protein